ncbi:MAG: hypothetical protein HFE40_00295 [Clostridia bacterium]|nr:hypothetical protein [Clostridia bacterium]
MANLDEQMIKKIKRGELLGNIALIGCAAVVVCFIIVFTTAQVKGLEDLKTACLIWTPVTLALSAAVAAVCNLKYGKTADRLIKEHVRDVFTQNASLMHPEKGILTYSISFEGAFFYVKANNFKEKIEFDFSAFGRISAARRAAVVSALTERLEITFCRLIERGANYTSVNYIICKNGSSGKPVIIIENGAPEKHAYKTYIKNK